MSSTHLPAVLLGSAIGDALGMPFEMRGARIHKDLKNWIGTMMPGDYHDLEAGHWTDDTEMATALASELVKHSPYVFDRLGVVKAYVNWLHNDPTGAGGTVTYSLDGIGDHLNALGDAEIDDETLDNLITDSTKEIRDDEDVGAGTVMRCAPIGVFYRNVPEMIRFACRKDAYITHDAEEAYAASLAVASFIAGICRTIEGNGLNIEVALEFMFTQMIPIRASCTFEGLSLINEYNAWDWSPKRIADSIAGRFGLAWQIAITSIHTAVHYMRKYELFPAEAFQRGVIEAIRLGGDTDTRGAVTGAILGAFAGTKALTELEWVKQLNHSSVPTSVLLNLDLALFLNKEQEE